MPYEDGSSKFNSSYIRNAYYNICNDYYANANEIWMNGYWFYTTEFADFVSGERALDALHLEVDLCMLTSI